VGASNTKRLPTDNVERFLSMLSFDSKGKLRDLGIDNDYFPKLKKKWKFESSFLFWFF